MNIFAIIWIIGAVLLLVLSHGMWIANEFEHRWLCIILCCIWVVVLGWAIFDGIKGVVKFCFWKVF